MKSNYKIINDRKWHHMFSVDLISLLDNIHSCNFKETTMNVFFNREQFVPSLEYFCLIANRDF